jgi:hypothetical protein
LVVPAVVAVAASMCWAGAARRAGSRRARAAWRYQSAACALWALVAIAWLAGATRAGLGQAGFRALAAAGLVLPLAGLVLPLARAVLIGFTGVRALIAFRAAERAVPAWFLGGVLALAAAGLDAGRGAGSAGLGWLLGFGCLAMAAHSYRGTAGDAARREALARLAASERELLDLAGHAPPAGRPSSGRPPAGARPGPILMVDDDAIFEAKRDGRPGVPAP